MITISAFALGISGFYLLFLDLIETPKAMPTVRSINENFVLRLVDGDIIYLINEIEKVEKELGLR